VEAIDGAVRGGADQFEIVEESAARAVPISGAFVAAAVIAVAIEEAVEAAEDFQDSFGAAMGIALGEEGGGEPVGADPRRPVVEAWRCVAGAGEAHPAEVGALAVGSEDAMIHFVVEARVDHRRELFKSRFEEVESPGDLRGSFGGEEIDDGIGIVGQAGSGFLSGEVRRESPIGFFAGGPEPIDDFVVEAAFAFDALGEGQGHQAGAAGVAELLVVGAIAVAFVFEEDARGQDGPIALQAAFAVFYGVTANVGGKRFPGGAFGRGRPGMPLFTRQEGRFQAFGADALSEQVARRLSGVWRRALRRGSEGRCGQDCGDRL